MKKLYYFFVKCGEILFIWSLLVIISISIQSLTIKGEVNYGDRCYQDFDDELIKKYEYEGVIYKEGNLSCNTYYLTYNSNLQEQQNLRFLISLSKLLLDNNIKLNFHVVIQCDEYQMLSTIVDYKVSYVTSKL